MLIAIVGGKRVHARDVESGQLGTCPFTGAALKAHVGPFRQFWVYPGGAPELPPGYEPESPWHYSWKHLVMDERCEVVYGANREHRADIVGADETIVELQHSPINAWAAEERTEFYATVTGKRVVWLLDAFEYMRYIDFQKPISGEKFGRVVWKNPRKWVLALAKDSDTHVFLDPQFVSDGVIKIWSHAGNVYWWSLTKRQFFGKYLASVSKPAYRDFNFKRYDIWRIYDN